jgi:hypothetical protein
VTGRRASFEATLAKARAEGDTAAIQDMVLALNRARIKRETYARAVDMLSKKAVQE